MTVSPLHPAITRGSHSRRELLEAGVTRGELGGPLWRRTNQGLWAWSPSTTTAWGRVLDAVPLVRGRGAIGGWAAALAHGVPDIDGSAGDGSRLPVLVCLPRSERCRRTRGVVVFRSELADDVVTRRGIPVTSLVRTAADLARRAGSLAEAVAALDRVLRIDAELPSTLAEWLDARRSWRGVTLARHALGLARAGTESPRETLLRLVWMLDAALPPPLVNPWLTDVRGNVIARPDLFDPVSAVVAEYDGSHHAGSTRRSRDHRRRETLERLGITVVQCTADDLGRAGRERTVGRLRSAHAAGMSRDRRQDRWAIAGLGRPD